MMVARHQIWRSRLWVKRGDERVIIHVITEPDLVRFLVVAAKKDRAAVILESGTEDCISRAHRKAELAAARFSSMQRMPDGLAIGGATH